MEAIHRNYGHTTPRRATNRPSFVVGRTREVAALRFPGGAPPVDLDRALEEAAAAGMAVSAYLDWCNRRAIPPVSLESVGPQHGE